MKTTIKTLTSIVALAFFLLIGWATSYEDDLLYPYYVEFMVKNQSDSCSISGIGLTYRVRRDNIDSLNLSGYEILPGDSLTLESEALNYQKLHYTCHCPGQVFSESISVKIDTFSVSEIVLDCD